MTNVKLGSFEMNVEVYPGLAPMDTVFIHGNLASNKWWEPSLEIWKAQAKPKNEGRFLLAEWRGCGKSGRVTDERQLAMKSMASDYVAMMRDLAVEKACVVAHSTGGLIALLAMLEAPELFHRAVLLDPVGGAGVVLGPEMLAAFTKMSRDRAFCAQVLTSTIHGVDPASRHFQSLVDDAYGIGELNWHGIPRALASVDITADLKKISQPVLVLHGEHDPILPKAESEKLAQQLPNAKYFEVKGQGHSLNVESPSLFVRLTSEFLYDQA